jgi:hypothetical protein
MKTAIITTLAGLALAFGFGSSGDLPVRKNAEPCSFCSWSGACYGHSICGSGCGCFKRNPWDTSGVCMSLD